MSLQLSSGLLMLPLCIVILCFFAVIVVFNSIFDAFVVAIVIVVNFVAVFVAAVAIVAVVVVAVAVINDADFSLNVCFTSDQYTLQ